MFLVAQKKKASYSDLNGVACMPAFYLIKSDARLVFFLFSFLFKISPTGVFKTIVLETEYLYIPFISQQLEWAFFTPRRFE